jgi:hypothetical protein
LIADSIAGQAAKFSMDLKPKEWPSFMDNVSLLVRILQKLTVKEGKKTHVYESKKILGQLFQLVRAASRFEELELILRCGPILISAQEILSSSIIPLTRW